MKKIFIFLVLFISQFIFGNNIFAAQIPVEKVFHDISKNYKYYNELQTLYDKGMIFPEEDGKFHPKKLLNRDEFVGISMEVACKKCIAPNTDFSLVKKYNNTKPFYDVNKSNKYFYCIAESDDLGYVKGYDKGYRCEGKTAIQGERPFCIDNKIRLDEALAVILRNSGIFTIKDNKEIIKKIYSGEITKKLADDVSPKNSLGQVYTFYGYLQKALNYQLKEVDKYGNEKIYKLLEKQNNKIYPERHISKEEFLIIAYIALKANSCIQDEKNNLALQINILNKDCKKGEKCNNKKFDKYEDTFDFGSKIGGVCKKGVEDKNYIWTFFSYNTGKEIIKKGKYIDNYKFLEKGKWRVILKVIDNCGNKGEVYSTLFIKDKKDIKNPNLGVEIDATPLYGEAELKVDFEGKVKGGKGPYKYEWDYGDGQRGEGKYLNHKYINPGTYTVKLKVTDSNGKVGYSTVTIVVTKKDIKNPNLGVEIDATPLYGEAELKVDFEGKVKGGKGPYKYEWDYGDGQRGEGKYLNHKYKKPGTYTVKLKVTDSNGKVGYSTVTIVVVTKKQQDKGLKVQINANPIIGNYDLNVNFNGIVSGGEGNYTYKWEFGDGTKGIGKNPNHIYTKPGVYEITLIVTDENGNTGKATVLTKVLDFDSCEIDADGDGVMDCDDILPKVPGEGLNDGAPILDNKCNADCTCQKGYECSIKNPNTCQNDGVCLPKKISLNSCLQNGFNTFIVGNSICDTCPCEYKLDFIATLRKCDLVFPAITSPDSKKIYGRGNIYKIQ